MPIRYDDEEPRVRITVSVEPDVWSEYMEASQSLGMSASRFIGDWLADTRESMAFVVNKMLEAKAATGRVLPHLETMMEEEDLERERQKLLTKQHERRRRTG